MYTFQQYFLFSSRVNIDNIYIIIENINSRDIHTKICVFCLWFCEGEDNQGGGPKNSRLQQKLLYYAQQYIDVCVLYIIHDCVFSVLRVRL